MLHAQIRRKLNVSAISFLTLKHIHIQLTYHKSALKLYGSAKVKRAKSVMLHDKVGSMHAMEVQCPRKCSS